METLKCRDHKSTELGLELKSVLLQGPVTSTFNFTTVIFKSIGKVPFYLSLDKLDLEHHLHFKLPHFMKDQLEYVKEMIIRVMKDLKTV